MQKTNKWTLVDAEIATIGLLLVLENVRKTKVDGQKMVKAKTLRHKSMIKKN